MKLINSYCALLSYISICVGAAAAQEATSDSYVQGKAFNRFITIWLENQDYDEVIKSDSIKALSSQGISLTNYYGLTHPSQPNYLASIAGDYFGLNHDGFVEIPPEVLTLVDLLEDANVTWKGYFEGLPGPGYAGQGSTSQDGSWDYVRKHNPFISFNSISHLGEKMALTQSLKSFYRDVEHEALPQYMHISPNMLNDGHNTTLDFAADWSAKFLEPLLANKYLMKDTLILLTYDESATYEKPNHIVSLLLGGAVPHHLKGSTDNTFYTHYSILSTLENNWSLANLGRFDVGANVFKTVADKTGWTGNYDLTADEQSKVDLSVSYSGSLNSDPNMIRPVPPPNLGLVGAGAKGVLNEVRKLWDKEKHSPTPYTGQGRIWEPLVYNPQSNMPS